MDKSMKRRVTIEMSLYDCIHHVPVSEALGDFY